jgi:hypothetical protein
MMEHGMEARASGIKTPDEHWGKALIRLLDTLDMSDWEALKIDDPVSWVKTLRQQGHSHLDPYWNGSR